MKGSTTNTLVMKGLRKYVRKHGRHFTDELALHAITVRWSTSDVVRSAQRKVYYNVTGATSGDMAYLANMVHFSEGWPKGKCISFCLSVIGDYGIGEGYAFRHFLELLSSNNRDFDFSDYI